MAGAYLELYPQDTFTLTCNVLLANVAQELYLSTLWFVAQADSFDPASGGAAPFINVNSAIAGGAANITISNGGGTVNSVATVSLASNYTANLPTVNSALWSLVARTQLGKVYTLDRGRIAVVSRVGVSFQ